MRVYLLVHDRRVRTVASRNLWLVAFLGDRLGCTFFKSIDDRFLVERSIDFWLKECSPPLGPPGPHTHRGYGTD